MRARLLSVHKQHGVVREKAAVDGTQERLSLLPETNQDNLLAGNGAVQGGDHHLGNSVSSLPDPGTERVNGPCRGLPEVVRAGNMRQAQKIQRRDGVS